MIALGGGIDTHTPGAIWVHEGLGDGDGLGDGEVAAGDGAGAGDDAAADDDDASRCLCRP